MFTSSRRPKIAVIGGGTGNFTLLKSLKDKPCEVTALVNMADDGGSTGVLRDELGVLPPGDVRQCLVALSEASDELRTLFSFRFPEGGLQGHSFGNLFLSALELTTNDFSEAVRVASQVLRIRGTVLPITLEPATLVLERGNKQVEGEYAITTTKLRKKELPKLSLQPNVAINPAAATALRDADLIVIAPGNLYGSLAPALLVSGVGQAIAGSKAKVAFVCNLVNKQHHTPDYDVCDYASEIERFIGGRKLDYVLYNTDTPSKELLDAYALDEEFPVLVDADRLRNAHYHAIGGHFLSHEHEDHNPNDTRIKRSLIRHDSEAIADVLLKLSKK